MSPFLIMAFGLYPIPVKNSSRPVFEVSMWPLNIRLLPLPVPSQIPSTFARPSSTSCQVTASPAASSAPRMKRPISSSSPVALGMLTASEHMAMSSSSRICDRIAFVKSSFIVSVFPRMDDVAIPASQTKIVGVRAQLLAAALGHKKIIFQAQATTAFPVHTRLDGQNHTGTHRTRGSLMRIRRLVRASPHAVSNGMRWLAGITGSRNPLPQDAINIPKRCSFPNARDSFRENRKQLVKQTVVFLGKPPGTNIFREVGPIAVGADPNLDQRWLVLDHRPMAGGRKGCDALPRPNQRERPGHLDFSLVTDAQRVDVAFDHGRDFAFLHSWLDILPRVLHADGCQFIGKTHALNFLRGLDHAYFGQQRRGVDDFAAARTKRIVITLPVNCRLAHHAIANLRKLRKLDAHAGIELPFAQNVNRHFGSAHHGRPRVFGVVEMEQADVFVPRRALRFAELRFDDQERWIAVARKNNEVISLHGPVVRQVKNVVRRADHQRIEMVPLEHLPDTLPLLFVDGTPHLATAFSLPW